MEMRAQVTLTPTESKRLISKAVAKLDVVQRALKEGIVAVHPSSTTFFLIEELTGKPPDGVWICGMVVPRGTCMEGTRRLIEAQGRRLPAEEEQRRREGAGGFRYLWVLKKGSLKRDLKLDSVVAEMGVDDVYIKAANALDPEGNAGVLLASEAGGTVSRIMGYALGRGFNVVVPVGLEKLIPTPMREAVKETGVRKMDYAMGIPVGLYPIPGTTVTEIDAVKILTGATAIPIAAGGVGGAEGAVTLVIRGDEGQVKKAVEIVEGVKGSKLPEIRFQECSSCTTESCHLWRKAKEAAS